MSTPPGSGKSCWPRCRGGVRADAQTPTQHDRQVIRRRAGREHSEQARRLITEHADLLGVELDQAKSAVGRWLVPGTGAACSAGGILSSTTGFGGRSGVLVVDDPIKGAAEADSVPAYRRRLFVEFRADLMADCIPARESCVITTRWHADDLSGTLISDDGTRWCHVNIPAIATGGVPDALHREPGVAMVSALGRDLEGSARSSGRWGRGRGLRCTSGAPSTDEGTLIRSEWLDSHRLPAAPARPVRTVVAVDPADSGDGDATGIIGASLAPDGTVCLIADASEQLTSDAWANKAVETAIALGASAIVVEGFSAATTYSRLLTEALRRQSPPHHITVSTWPPKGRTRVGDALARSAGLLAALENGGCVIAGHLPALEARWSAGSRGPTNLTAWRRR